MSAFVVSKAHIDALVTGVMGARITQHEPSEVGRILWHENHVSVNYRYKQHDAAPEYYWTPRSVPPVALLKAIACYEYQACEHEGWEASEAHKLMEHLRHVAITNLPGYEEAAWEIADPVPAPQPEPEQTRPTLRLVTEAPPAPEPAPAAPAIPGPDYSNRDVAIKAIRDALRRRSGKAWSVTGGRGTAWGWIHIHVPPARRSDLDTMTATEAGELARLLGLDHVHEQGVSIPASHEYRAEYVARAEGRKPETFGTPYWD